MAVCPVKAISRNGDIGRVEIDYDVCIGLPDVHRHLPFWGRGI
jgi:Fe-S-cluster-containing dehydrogenase component